MSEKPTPPWANEIPEGSFISYATTYKVGEYFDRFHKICIKGPGAGPAVNLLQPFPCRAAALQVNPIAAHAPKEQLHRTLQEYFIGLLIRF